MSYVLLHHIAQLQITSYHIADMGHGCIPILQSNVSRKWIKICVNCIHSKMLKGAHRKTAPFTVGLERGVISQQRWPETHEGLSKCGDTPANQKTTAFLWRQINIIFRILRLLPQKPLFIGSVYPRNTLGSWAVTSARWETSAVMFASKFQRGFWGSMVFCSGKCLR